MNKMLLHPGVTLGVIISGCIAIDTLCGGIVSAIQPLANVHGFEHVTPTISVLCAGLVVVSNSAIALAGIGRSILKAVDELKVPDASSNS